MNNNSDNCCCVVKSIHIPEDVLTQILSRLPAKSLVRFRCVSKSWLLLIDHPQFSRLHLCQFNNNNNTNLLVTEKLDDWMGWTSKFWSVRRCSDTVDVQSSQVPGDSVNRNTKIVCSMDGLVLLIDIRRGGMKYPRSPKLMLWNPSIRRVRLLPLSPILEGGSKADMMDLGFGFDPLINDYKLVRVAYAPYDLYSQRKLKLLSIEVYIVGVKLWKKIQFRGNWCWRFDEDCGSDTLCFRGALYFTLLRNTNSRCRDLVWFDLSKEVFASTDLPKECSLGSPALVDDGGCSLRLINPSLSIWSIWVLHDHFWTKCYTLSPYDYSYYECHRGVILCLKKTGDMLIKSRRRELISFNVKTRQGKPLFKVGSEGMLLDRDCEYKESLLLLNG